MMKRPSHNSETDSDKLRKAAQSADESQLDSGSREDLDGLQDWLRGELKLDSGFVDQLRRIPDLSAAAEPNNEVEASNLILKVSDRRLVRTRRWNLSFAISLSLLLLLSLFIAVRLRPERQANDQNQIGKNNSIEGVNDAEQESVEVTDPQGALSEEERREILALKNSLVEHRLRLESWNQALDYDRQEELILNTLSQERLASDSSLAEIDFDRSQTVAFIAAFTASEEQRLDKANLASARLGKRKSGATPQSNSDAEIATALIMLADYRIQDSGETEVAEQNYRLVKRLFPQTEWSQVASDRLMDLGL